MKNTIIFLILFLVVIGTLILFGRPTLGQENLENIGEIGENVKTISEELLRIQQVFSIQESVLSPPDKQKVVENMVAIAKERKRNLEELLKTNPSEVFFLLLPKSAVERLPIEVQAETERLVSLQGKLDVKHIDEFDGERFSEGKFEYTLQAGGNRFAFYPVGDFAAVSDTTLNVNGFQIGNNVIAQVGESTQEGTFQVAAAPQLESVGDQRTLVILVKYPDSGPEPFSVEEARNLIFNGPFQEFMREQSYGRVSFSGDVVGWHTMLTGGQPNLSSATGATGIVNFLRQNNIDLRNYRRILYVQHHPSFGGGSWYVGTYRAMIDGQEYRFSESWVAARQFSVFNTRVPFRWSNLDYLLSHELGHALGLWHANRWECGVGQYLRGPCRHIEYGDFFDAMGNAWHAPFHFNALHKELLGWLRADEFLTITRSGRYTLYPFESDSRAPRAAKIQPVNSTRAPFYLEARRALGFDRAFDFPEFIRNQLGLFIRWARIFDGGAPLLRTVSYLLDLSPSSRVSLPDSLDVTLNPRTLTPRIANEELLFTDLERGIRIGNVFSEATSTTFQVILTPPQCIRGTPMLTTFPQNLTIYQGLSTYFSVMLQNRDSNSCLPLSIRTNSLLRFPPPLRATFYNTNPLVALPEGPIIQRVIGLHAPHTTPPGPYTVRLRVREAQRELPITVERPPYLLLVAEPVIGDVPFTTTLIPIFPVLPQNPITYSLWWHCRNLTPEVSTAEASCGALPTPPTGQCQENNFGTRCTALSPNRIQTFSHTYTTPGFFTPKIIVQSGTTSPLEANTPIIVRGPSMVAVPAPIEQPTVIQMNKPTPEAGRQTKDRPDDNPSAKQIHAMYVLPSDGVDRGYDTNGSIATSIAAFQRWHRGQTRDKQFRMDTYQGKLDITLVRLGRTDAQLQADAKTMGSPLYLRDILEREVRSLGFNDPHKFYAVYYEGGSGVSACGGGAWPPTLPGNVAAMYLLACSNPFASSETSLGYLDIAMFREIYHSLGAVSTCAPRHTRAGHVSDSPDDFMWAGTGAWLPSGYANAILDVGRDDYYGLTKRTCESQVDIAQSPFLETVGTVPVPTTPPTTVPEKPDSITIDVSSRILSKAGDSTEVGYFYSPTSVARWEVSIICPSQVTAIVKGGGGCGDTVRISGFSSWPIWYTNPTNTEQNVSVKANAYDSNNKFLGSDADTIAIPPAPASTTPKASGAQEHNLGVILASMIEVLRMLEEAVKSFAR